MAQYRFRTLRRQRFSRRFPSVDCRKIKKIELHRHLEGAVRLQTVIDVADEAGIRLPTTDLETLKNHALVLKPMKDLGEVLNKFMLVQSALATPSILERVAYENCIDAYNDGIRVIELRYSPGFITLNHPKLKSYDLIVKSINDGVARAKKELKGKLAVGLICVISGDQSKIEAEKTTDFVVANHTAFVGFDLAGDEKVFPPQTFKKHFEKVRKTGLGITVHSGEIPGSAKSVKVCITELGAQRIGHGIQIIHEPEIMDFVREHGVPLEVCPTSNVLTRGVERIQVHPLPQLLSAGVPVTLNSDDPGIFGIDLTHEYEVCLRDLNLNQTHFDQMNSQALKSTFIDSTEALKAWNS